MSLSPFSSHFCFHCENSALGPSASFVQFCSLSLCRVWHLSHTLPSPLQSPHPCSALQPELLLTDMDAPMSPAKMSRNSLTPWPVKTPPSFLHNLPLRISRSLPQSSPLLISANSSPHMPCTTALQPTGPEAPAPSPLPLSSHTRLLSS